MNHLSQAQAVKVQDEIERVVLTPYLSAVERYTQKLKEGSTTDVLWANRELVPVMLEYGTALQVVDQLTSDLTPDLQGRSEATDYPYRTALDKAIENYQDLILRYQFRSSCELSPLENVAQVRVYQRAINTWIPNIIRIVEAIQRETDAN